jgi:transcription termination factor NusB
MLNLSRNTRLFFFQYIFQRDYSTDFELDEFIFKNIKKRPFNKRKLKSLYNSFNSNGPKSLKIFYHPRLLKKTNKISIFLIYAFFAEYLLDKNKKNILMGEYIKLSKEFLTVEEVKYFNFLLDNIAQKAP